MCPPEFNLIIICRVLQGNSFVLSAFPNFHWKNNKFNIFTGIGNQKNALSHSCLDFDLIIDIDVAFWKWFHSLGSSCHRIVATAFRGLFLIARAEYRKFSNTSRREQIRRRRISGGKYLNPPPGPVFSVALEMFTGDALLSLFTLFAKSPGSFQRIFRKIISMTTHRVLLLRVFKFQIKQERI